jgi:hypothetical protein
LTAIEALALWVEARHHPSERRPDRLTGYLDDKGETP